MILILLNLVTQTMKRLCKTCMLFTNLHFWSITTFAPILLLIYHQQRRKKMSQRMIENQHDYTKLSQHHMSWGQLLGLEDTSLCESLNSSVNDITSDECSDFNLCLLENWSFC